MKFTLSWLRTHLDTGATIEAITDRLTNIGLELESITDPGAPLAPFRVAKILTAEQHPNADRLRACTVDAGLGGDPISVVCGAPNARAGIKVVFAPPGAHIPGTGITLEVGKIRGVTSAGMLLSLREMALGEKPRRHPRAPRRRPHRHLLRRLRQPLRPRHRDRRHPQPRRRPLHPRHRPRPRASGLGTLIPWSPTPIPATFESPVNWAIENTTACPWILGRTIRNVTNGPSPEWLQRRLQSIGLRPINALVDVTNFFTFDLGRPLHVFDADRITGPTLTLRPGAPPEIGETFRALNGKDYTATPEDCVIADAAGVQSLAGIMGGEPTSCTEATTSVFIECALFDPVATALSGPPTRHHQRRPPALRARHRPGTPPRRSRSRHRPHPVSLRRRTQHRRLRRVRAALVPHRHPPLRPPRHPRRPPKSPRRSHLVPGAPRLHPPKPRTATK